MRSHRPSWWCSLLIVAVAACGKGGGTEPAVPTTITIGQTSPNLDAIGATQQLTASVKDQRGQPMPNQAVSWLSTVPSVATVSSGGLVTAVTNGSAQIQASAGSASAQVGVTVAQVPNAIVKISADPTPVGPNTTIPAPLVVQVNDRLAHPTAGVMVSFATTSGSVTPTSMATIANGQAQTSWTVGASIGPQTATASVTGIANPATFGVTVAGAAPTITSITPDTLIEGQAATINGTNFSATPANNTVAIDGVTATVNTASPTSLSITVPFFSCKPARIASVAVTVAAQTANSSAPVHPVSFLSLAVGQQSIVQNPSNFCLQFRSATSGPETYVFGLSAPAESPGSVLPFRISQTAGTAAAAAPSLAQRASADGPSVAPDLAGAVRALRQRAAAEAKIRQWEAANLPRLRAQTTRSPGGVTAAPGAPPAVGDTVTIRVPTLSAGNPCASFTTIKTVTRVVGSAGIWLADVQNPTADTLTLAEIQSASNQFDTDIYASDTLHFGHPSDIDANSRIFIVLTWQVNKQGANLGGFVWGGDLFPGVSCPQSNAGELYYGEVPDPTNQAGTGARQKSTIVSRMPLLVAHEFTHVIQFSQRLILNNGQMLNSWDAEGQATFAEELAGNAVLGNTSFQNYGASVAFGVGGIDWYEDEILKWAEYYGDLGPNNQAANAPDLCTVYGNTSMTTLPCDVAAFYGASWIFQRYIGDQFGPGYAGGLTQLTRDWLMKNPTLVGSANIAALLGVNYDTLFARFATALALDDLDNGTGTAWVPQAFRITSWNSADIAGWISTCCGFGWLNPPQMGFASTTLSRSVRGGSTAYTKLSAAGAHSATAIALTDASGNALSAALRPTLWVVRVR